MKIALCEDEEKERESTSLLVKKYKQIRPNADVSFNVFSSGDELLSYLEIHGGFDLYILDVIMPKMNGIETGLQIRNLQDDGLIVYMTTSADFAVDSYQTQAFNYLLKPVKESRFFEVLDRAYAQIETKKTNGITVKVVGGIMKLIPINSILYVELVNRSVRYYLVGGEVIDSLTFRGAFHNEIEPLLRHDVFALCGSSFAVNLRYVSEVKRGNIILNNGETVPISRNLYSTVKKQWMFHWLERR